MKQTDAAIIGFGTAGKALGLALAEAGKQVAIIEQSDQMYGGACPNVACIPTKALVHAAEVSAALGGEFDDHAERYAAAIDEKNELTRSLRVKSYDALANHPHVSVIDATASFISENTLSLACPACDDDLEADEIFIDTGSAPTIPPIPGADGPHVYTSKTLLQVRVLPERLLVIGGGYVGIEFASLFANFSSAVTIVQDGETFLPREDEAIAAAVLASLTDRGIRVMRGANVARIEDNVEEVLVFVQVNGQEERIPCDAVLMATGRHPNIEALDLGAAGIELTERGGIRTDEHLRTNVPNVWALGDARGEEQFTYLAYDDFRIAASDVLGNGARTTENRGAVPYAVFCDPPFARIGMTEREARDAGLSVLTAEIAGDQITRARMLGRPVGLLKAVVDARTERLLGLHLFCLESPEIINIAKIAMDAALPYPVLRDAIFTHPTMAESLNNLLAALT